MLPEAGQQSSLFDIRGPHDAKKSPSFEEQNQANQKSKRRERNEKRADQRFFTNESNAGIAEKEDTQSGRALERLEGEEKTFSDERLDTQ